MNVCVSLLAGAMHSSSRTHVVHIDMDRDYHYDKIRGSLTLS